jgi:aminopeptidase YwaD
MMRLVFHLSKRPDTAGAETSEKTEGSPEAFSLPRDPPESLTDMPTIYADLIRRTYRGEVAHRHVTAISQHHRIQASPGYRAAAEYVAAQLEAAGLEVAIHRYPADGRARFWTTPSFLEWACEGAVLRLLNDAGAPSPAPADLLCDYAALPTSLIQRSIPVEGEFEVIALRGKGGIAPEDYAGLDVRGRVVLTGAPVARVAELAIRHRGAAGILFDGMVAGGRTELDLPDARQYTSFWWGGETVPDAWGFVLSPRQGRMLRAALTDGKPVRVRASIRSRFYAGAFEVVDAHIPGATVDISPATTLQPPAEILLVSHLCHPQPGAHDNGSGAAALIETAVTLARLIADGRLPRPRRGIRFLWPPEMTGTFAWLAEREEAVRVGRWLAGLNLDMVGADQCQTGSVWELVSLPAAGAGFADHLLSWLREPFLEGVRHREAPFADGSDHYILADPSVGIPTPMLNQWPDKFYHTSADTPDRVSPDSLGRSGALAAIYAYWLAIAGPADAAWLGHLMASRCAAQAGREAAAMAESLRAAGDSAVRSSIWSGYRRASAFRAERMEAALESLSRLGIEPAALAELQTRAAGVAAAEDAYIRSLLSEEEAQFAPTAEVAGWRTEAATLTPRRLAPGPIDVALALQADRPHLVPNFWKLGDDAGDALHDSASLLQYWADSYHTIADIADRVELEMGKAVGELALRYFKLLAEAGLITMDAEC